MTQLHFSASVQDELTVRRSTDVYLNPAASTTLSAMIADFNAWLTALDSVTAGAIVGSQIRITPDTSGLSLKASPDSGSRNGDPGEVRFNITGTQNHWTTVIPAVTTAAITSGKLNLTALSVYTSLLLGSSSYTTPDGLALASVREGFIGGRKSRKQQQRATTSTP